MASDDDAPRRPEGRRKGKGPPIELVATEVAAVPSAGGEAAEEPIPTASAGAEAAPDVVPTPGPDVTGTTPDRPATVDAEAEALFVPSADAVATDAPSVAVPPADGGDAPTADAPTASADAATADAAEASGEPTPGSADPLAGPASAGPDAPPTPVAAPTREEPRRGSFAGLAAAAALGGLVVLAGGAALLGSGALTPKVETVAPADFAALAERVKAVETTAATPPAPDETLARRVAALEEAAAAPVPEGVAPERLAAIEAEVAALAERPLPTPAPAAPDPAPRLDALDAAVAALKDGQAKGNEAIAGLTAELTRDPTRVDALATEIRDLAGAVEALRADRTADAETLAGLSARPVVDPARLDALDAGLKDLAGRVDGLAATLGETRAAVEQAAAAAGSAGEAVAAAADRIGPVEGRIAAVEARLDAGPKGGEIAALSLAITGLGSKLAAGRPFPEDLALVRAALPDAEGLDALAAVADGGVATLEELRASLPVAAMVAARPAEGAGVTDRLWSGAKSLVNYRETGEGSDDPLSAPLSAVEAALAAGDLTAAQAAAAGLPDWAKAPASGWLKALDARVAADAVLATLTGRVLERLQAPAEGR